MIFTVAAAARCRRPARWPAGSRPDCPAVPRWRPGRARRADPLGQALCGRRGGRAANGLAGIGRQRFTKRRDRRGLQSRNASQRRLDGPASAGRRRSRGDSREAGSTAAAARALRTNSRTTAIAAIPRLPDPRPPGRWSAGSKTREDWAMPSREKKVASRGARGGRPGQRGDAFDGARPRGQKARDRRLALDGIPRRREVRHERVNCLEEEALMATAESGTTNSESLRAALRSDNPRDDDAER